MKYLSLLMATWIAIQVNAQDCSCASNFEWVKKTFEENDAGFAYALESKSEKAYQQHNADFAERVKDIKDPLACNETLYEWLSFFRSGHIGIRNLLETNSSNGGSSPSDKEIRKRFADWESQEVDLKAFEAYLAEKKEADYEGIWENPPYKIGIRQVGDEYLGFIIKADGVYWTEGQIKLRIGKEGKKATYYMRDHSPREFEEASILGNNVLQMGFVTLERLAPKFAGDPAVERYFRLMETEEPFFEQLDASTSLIRIPSFNNSMKPTIDSVIAANRATILRSENFIIDLRNNGGGSDRSYSELIPFLYTNPIRTVGVEMYSTELNNKRMLDFVNNPDYGFSDSEKEWAQNAYDKLAARPGEFVSLEDEWVSIETMDSIYTYPKNVGVIINENNGSTTEQFLLAAKQSKKVKLFGTTTAGVLDISNMMFVPSPCEEFELAYSLSRSMRIPEMAIDDKGIQPDYYIAKDVPAYKWVDFVHRRLMGE